MSYQGLFTQGTTVDELLAKRSKRQQDMQQQLMNQAAQGARDPQRARMGSMFGSILGRALGDNAGGADTERQALEAKNLSRDEMQRKVLASADSDSTALQALSEELQNKGFPMAAQTAATKFAKKLQEEKVAAAAAQVKAQDDLTTRANLEAKNTENAELQERAVLVAQGLPDDSPLKRTLLSGNAPEALVLFAEKESVKRYEDKPLTNDGRLLVESGMTEGTLEFQLAIKDIIAKKGTLTQLPTPMEQRKFISGVIQNDKQYIKAKEKLTMLNDALNLVPSVLAGGQKNTALFERATSEAYNSQTKAVSEIDRLISQGSWGRGMSDWISKGFKGQPSAVTIDEYEQVLNIMDVAMRGVVNGVVKTQAGIYGDLMSGDNLEASISNLRMEDSRGASQEKESLGESLGSTTKPDGAFTQNGKSYIIKGGQVYEN